MGCRKEADRRFIGPAELTIFIKQGGTVVLRGAICLLVLASFCTGKTLRKELNEIEKLWVGRKPLFDEAEKRYGELLNKYSKPEEQGRIYFHLSLMYAQTGQVRPNKTIAWSKKAFEYPLDPLDRLRLYIHWGDAIQVANRGARGQELMVARRKAVMPYLQGLKETIQYNLPERRPEIPRIVLEIHYGSRDSKTLARIKRKNEEQRKARQRVMWQREMILFRDILTGQIAFLYSRFPFATNELRELATEVLEDKAAVERLMGAVEKAVKKRMDRADWKLPSELPENLDSMVAPVLVKQATVTVPKLDVPTTRPTLHQDKQFARAIPGADADAKNSNPWLIVGIGLLIGLLSVAFVRFVVVRMRACQGTYFSKGPSESDMQE